MSAVASSVRNIDPTAVRRRLQLSRERMARVLRVSAKTVERWERRQALPDDESVRRAFTQLQQIADLAHAVYTEEGVGVFLASPIASLNGRTPLELMSLGDYDQVIAILAADFEGLGY